MPELPEVETSRRGIEPHLAGATILHAIIRNGRLRWPVSDEIHRLSDQPVLSVQRRAKYLLLELPTGWIIIHLGMSGSLRVLTEDVPSAKHDHVDLVMSNGKILRYTDPRRFGAWLWSSDLANSNVLAHLGPEPLSNTFSADYLFDKSLGRFTPVKPWLMDNKLVVGVGNIYASESLFAAGIHPDRPATALSYEEAALLVNTIKAVLMRSIEQGVRRSKIFCRRMAGLGILRRNYRFTAGQASRAVFVPRRYLVVNMPSAALSIVQFARSECKTDSHLQLCQQSGVYCIR